MESHTVQSAGISSEPCRYSFDRQKRLLRSHACVLRRATLRAPAAPKINRQSAAPLRKSYAGLRATLLDSQAPLWPAATLVSCFGARAAPRSRRRVCRARCDRPAGVVPAWRWSWRTDTDSVAAHAPSLPAV